MKVEDIDKGIEIQGSKGNKYEIHIVKGKVICSCPARVICKHIKEYEFKRALTNKLTDWESRGFINTQSPGAFNNIIEMICKIRKEWL